MHLTWRLLSLRLADGPWNMAADEAILDSVASGESPLSLRFYAWSRPCVSVGCGQPVADLDLAECRRLDLPVVRRASGGTAVLHEASLGFSLALPTGHPFAAADIVESYRRLGEPVLAALGRLGVEGRLVPVEEAHCGPRLAGPAGAACFAALAPYEVLCRGRKIVGNSQVRRRGAVLHHALIPLAFDAGRLASLLQTGSRAEDEWLAGFLEERIGSLGWALCDVAAAEGLIGGLVAALTEAFAEALGGPPEVADLSPQEDAAAHRLVEEKYGNEGWTNRR